jgi:DNA-binding transcriptional regulator YiaG
MGCMGPTVKTAKSYRDKIAALGITDARFARIARVDGRTVRRWAAGERKFEGPPEALLDLLVDRPELLALLPD